MHGRVVDEGSKVWYNLFNNLNGKIWLEYKRCNDR